MRDYLSKTLQNVSRILGIRFLYGWLLEPKSENEDGKHKERVLNLLLIGTICVMILLGISIVFSSMHPNGTYSGVSYLAFLGIFVFFCFLLYLSRKGCIVFASKVLVILYLVVTLICVIQWTFLVPMVILAAVLTITISSILISVRFSFLLTGLISVCIIGITILQTSGILPLNLSWQHDGISVQDVIEICCIFFLVSTISWLSNRETEKSLARARASEATLLIERDQLEIKIEERTRELKELQHEQISKLAQLAEVGKTASGIFHDLMNPLNNVVASIETLSKTNTTIADITLQVEKAVRASKRMGDLISMIQKQIKPSQEITNFLPSKEIAEAIDILAYKARLSSVTCSLSITNEACISGNPILFHQIAVNLISNAIDAYRNGPNDTEKTVLTSLDTKNGFLVMDVADNGCGIPSEYTQKIFEPFFTTKESQGMGIGLSHIKRIVEKDFGGSISFISSPDNGTVFSVTIPLS